MRHSPPSNVWCETLWDIAGRNCAFTRSMINSRLKRQDGCTRRARQVGGPRFKSTLSLLHEFVTLIDRRDTSSAGRAYAQALVDHDAVEPHPGKSGDAAASEVVQSPGC